MNIPATTTEKAPATALTVPERDRLKRSQYEQDTSTRVGTPMSIQRVPEVPFAQIANEALRDKRLSFKARGVLALVLSNVGEWEATMRWLENQSDKDGKRAIQAALNELTDLGYRQVTYESRKQKVITVVEWRHISCPPQNVTSTKRDEHKTGGSLEHYPLEHYSTEQHQEEQSPTKTDEFDHFWTAYPRKAGKGAARKAWVKAVTKVHPDLIIAAAMTYRRDPNREDAFTAHASTWLNDERWDDEPMPSRVQASGRVNRLETDLAHLTSVPLALESSWK